MVKKCKIKFDKNELEILLDWFEIYEMNAGWLDIDKPNSKEESFELFEKIKKYLKR